MKRLTMHFAQKSVSFSQTDGAAENTIDRVLNGKNVVIINDDLTIYVPDKRVDFIEVREEPEQGLA